MNVPTDSKISEDCGHGFNERKSNENLTMLSSTNDGKDSFDAIANGKTACGQVENVKINLLRQMLYPKIMYLDEDAMVLEVNKNSAKDSVLRQNLNQHYYGDRRKDNEMSSKKLACTMGGTKFSYPFYLSSSSSSSSGSSSSTDDSTEDDLEDCDNEEEDVEDGDSQKMEAKNAGINSERNCRDDTPAGKSTNLKAHFGDKKNTVDEILDNSDILRSATPSEDKMENSTMSMKTCEITVQKTSSPKKPFQHQNAQAQHSKIKSVLRRSRTQRLTRRMKRDLKNEKRARDMLGLESLISAVKELEKNKKLKEIYIKKGTVKKESKRKHMNVEPSDYLKTKKSTEIDCEHKSSKGKHKNEIISSTPLFAKITSPSASASKMVKIFRIIVNNTVYRKKVQSFHYQTGNETPSIKKAKKANSRDTKFKGINVKKSKGKREPDKGGDNKKELSLDSRGQKDRIVSPPTPTLSNSTILEKQGEETCSSGGDSKTERIVTMSPDTSSLDNLNNPNARMGAKRKRLKFQSSDEEHTKAKKKGPQNVDNIIDAGLKKNSDKTKSDKYSALNEAIDYEDTYSSELYNYLSKSPNNPEHHTMSLSLLDWHRRQQWVPMTPSSSVKAPASLSCNEDISHTPLSTTNTPRSPLSMSADSIVPSWNNLNATNLVEMPKNPSALEPPRKRHKKFVYASWCCQLVNCLSGSGRSNAHYEFFYSDIDRAWFNFNEFKVDVAKLGVPMNAKLTRREWSLIRRRIRHRPRIFSQRFIKNQLKKLEDYRIHVRKIQRSKGEIGDDGFPFEVPAPIPIGATVTAFNKKFRILHRGIVLTRDLEYRYRYMIQFERKELGCEFCPDTEVASHGCQPDLIRPYSYVAFDGSYLGGCSSIHNNPGLLPYGTSYGPLIDFHKQQNLDAVSRARGVVRALHNEMEEVNIDEKEGVAKSVWQHDDQKAEPNAPPTSNSFLPEPSVIDDDMIETMLEKECLVSLLGMLEATIDRKAMILEAIDAFYSNVETHLRAKNQKANGKVLPNLMTHEFIEHHKWLHANLSLTNNSLYAAQRHLQIMYGKAYSCRPIFQRHHDVRHEVEHRGHNMWINGAEDENSILWLEQTTKECDYIGMKASSQVIERKDENEMDMHRSTYLKSRLAFSLSLLVSVHLLANNYSEQDEHSSVVRSTHIEKLLEQLSENLQPRPLPKEWLLYSQHDRDKGYLELQEALKIFRAELMMSRTTKVTT